MRRCAALAVAMCVGDGDLPRTMWSCGNCRPGSSVLSERLRNPSWSLTVNIQFLLFTSLSSNILRYMTQIRTHDGIRNMLVDTPSSRAISRSRRLFSSSVTRIAPERELVRPILVPGRAPECEAALAKGGALGRSGASHSQRAFLINYIQRYALELDASLRLADRRGRVAECVSALTR